MRPVPKESRAKTGLLDSFRYWKASPAAYKKLVSGLLLFMLFNSSDVFLLLKIKDAGLSDIAAIGMYVFYNMVYALAAYPMGIIADRIGLKKVFIAGLLLFAIVYFGMAFSKELYLFIALFMLYGIYAAATEGVAKAWISNISDKRNTATAIGTFTSFQSISALLASTITGAVWYNAGPFFAFAASGVVALLTALYFASNNFGQRVGQEIL